MIKEAVADRADFALASSFGRRGNPPENPYPQSQNVAEGGFSRPHLGQRIFVRDLQIVTPIGAGWMRCGELVEAVTSTRRRGEAEPMRSSLRVSGRFIGNKLKNGESGEIRGGWCVRLPALNGNAVTSTARRGEAVEAVTPRRTPRRSRRLCVSASKEVSEARQDRKAPGPSHSDGLHNARSCGYRRCFPSCSVSFPRSGVSSHSRWQILSGLDNHNR
jgi:hypothetical protein